MKHTSLLGLYVFLSILFLFAQDVDSSISISHFQYPETEGIPIILDEVGENTYFLNVQNPEFITDLHINQVQLDGSSGIPLGSYFLPDLLQKSPQAEEYDEQSYGTVLRRNEQTIINHTGTICPCGQVNAFRKGFRLRFNVRVSGVDNRN